MTQPLPALVSTDWLAAHLDTPGLLVLDASHHLPAAARDAEAEFAAAHIPGARFLGMGRLFDSESSVPYALPRPEHLAARLAQLGAAPGARIVVYDDSALRSAARAWFMLTASGWAQVAMLDGGLGKWRAEGRALETAAATAQPAAPAALHAPRGVRTKAEMLDNLARPAAQVLDARPPERVYGEGIDPVHGGPNGRIPGALNLPHSALFNADGTYLAPGALRAAFTAAGIDLARPIVTTCGSGVTASVLMFALHLIGVEGAALYDGSWSEWSADPDTPKLQGPGA